MIDLLSLRLPDEEPPEPEARFNTAAAEGHLVAFYPVEKRTQVKTQYGDADAVLCSRVVDLETGRTERDVLVFGSVLTVNIAGGIPDATVLGRIGKGDGTQGRTKPWVLLPHTQDDLGRFVEWMKSNP